MKLLSAEDLNFENDLAHFGVLGMKWGRRKAKSSSSGSSRKPMSKKEKRKLQTKKTQVKLAAMYSAAAVAAGAAMYGLSVAAKNKNSVKNSDPYAYSIPTIEINIDPETGDVYYRDAVYY